MSDAIKEIQQRQLLEGLRASVPAPLAGDEDADTRHVWAAEMLAKHSLWPFEVMDIETVFNRALVGAAWQEYRAMKPNPAVGNEEAESDADFAHRVISTFKTPPPLSTVEGVNLIAKLRQTKLRKGETLDDAFLRVQKSMSRLGWDKKRSDELLIDIFTNLLPHQDRKILMSKRDLTPVQVLASAKRMQPNEELSDLDNTPFSPAQGGMVQSSAASSVSLPKEQFQMMMAEAVASQQPAMAALSDEMTKLKVLVESMPKNSNGKNRKSKPQLNAMHQPGAPQAARGSKADLVCQICSKPYHSAKDCWVLFPPNPAEKMKQEHPVQSCQLCDQTGHTAKECNRNRSKSTVRCFRCDEPGHKKNECPNIQSFNTQQRRYFSGNKYQSRYQQYGRPQQNFQQQVQPVPQMLQQLPQIVQQMPQPMQQMPQQMMQQMPQHNVHQSPQTMPQQMMMQQVPQQVTNQFQSGNR